MKKLTRKPSPNLEPRAGLTVSIEIDDSAQNPRNDRDNLSIFYAPYSRNYTTRGKQDFECSPVTLTRYLKEEREIRAVIVPFHNPNVGECYAVIERTAIIKEYGNDSRSSLYHARRCAKGEIFEYLAWVNGEVYGYVIENEEHEHIDSCWGYYGREWAEEAAAEALAGAAEEIEKQQGEVDARFELVTQSESE